MSKGWENAGRLADVLQILTAVAGVAAVALTVAGVDVLADPNDQTLLSGAAVFGMSGVIAIASAIVRVQADNSGFIDGGRSTNRMLYMAGVVLLVLAAVTVGVFALRAPGPVAEVCVVRA